MPAAFPSLDAVVWRRVVDPSFRNHHVDFEYSVLGYDLAAGRVDMLLRYGPGGHCRPHRHVASTATLVLEGEQILAENLPDGSIRRVHRRKGDYALAGADAHPHDEHGGDQGGTVLLSMVAHKGLLFEYFDDDMRNPWPLSIDAFVDSWINGTIYGAPAASE